MEENKLMKSHLIPKFVGRYIKKTSLASNLRNLHGNVNKPEQDLLKEYLLCDSCEGLLNNFETPFSNNIFRKLHDGDNKFNYDEWLLKFVVSISWRIGISELQKEYELTSQQQENLTKTLEVWRDYLMGNKKLPSSSNHNIYLIEKSKFENSIGYFDYFFRSVDSHLNFSLGKKGAIYTLLPGILMVSYIGATSNSEWKNTRIYDWGEFRLGSQKASIEITKYMLDRAMWTTKTYLTNLNEEQRNKIEEKIKKSLLNE